MRGRLGCGLLYLLVAGAYAQAADPTVINFSCGGTVKTDDEGQRVAVNKVGLVVDLAEHTVSFAGFVAHIQNLDGANVFFGGGEDRATGDFDRVTGVFSATAVSGNVGKSYELFCKAVTPSKSQKTK